jgi:hypothetical protein
VGFKFLGILVCEREREAIFVKPFCCWGFLFYGGVVARQGVDFISGFFFIHLLGLV